MLLALLTVAALGQEPEYVENDALEVTHRVFPEFPREHSHGSFALECAAHATISAEGKPLAIEVVEFCPDAFARSVVAALEQWTWEPPGRLVATIYTVTFRASDASSGPPPPTLQRDELEKVLAAYQEVPSEAHACALGVTVHPNGAISALTSSRLPDCLAIPAGDPTPPPRIRNATFAVTCTAQLEARRYIARVHTYDAACPASYRRQVRAILTAWIWPHAVEGTPYDVTVRFVPTTPATPG